MVTKGFPEQFPARLPVRYSIAFRTRSLLLGFAAPMALAIVLAWLTPLQGKIIAVIGVLVFWTIVLTGAILTYAKRGRAL